ncbi:MAG: TraR/DksA family transcriptional regulator [Thermoleophilia bacterium]|jgi:DnaK suppressor protein
MIAAERANMEHERLRRQLTSERERVTREVDALEGELADPSLDPVEERPHRQHMAEAASYAVEREMDLTLEENARNVLARIDHALEKLDRGTYGVCDSCGGEIGKARLRASMHAALCIDCQRRRERGV